MSKWAAPVGVVDLCGVTGELNMSRYESRLQDLDVSIPDLPKPIANYIPAKRSGSLVFTAGQVSSEKGRDYKGKLGADLSLDDARHATRACVINCLASVSTTTAAVSTVIILKK